MVKSRVVNNALWIIACRIIQSVLQFVITILTARYLGPSNYGIINYAASLTAFCVPIMQLGINSIIVHELVNTPKQEGEILGTAIIMNVTSGILCMIGIIAFTAVSTARNVETIVICSLYSLSMLMEAVLVLQYWFQARLMSKYTSLATLVAYCLVSVYQIMILVTGKNIYWFAVSKALDIVIIDAILMVLYRRFGGRKLQYSCQVGKNMLRRSRYYILANMMTVIFVQTDRIMIKNMISDTATGYYAAASACAGITAFIFSAIIDSTRPSILKCKENHKTSYINVMTALYSIIIYLSLAQSIAITLLSKQIITILYGDEYESAINTLRIIVWYTTFSYLGAVRNVWILAENKQHLIWRVNMTGAVANVLLNLLLIPIWGINGAALATLITQFVTNVIMCFVFKELRPTLVFMKKSFKVRHLYTTIGGKLYE